MSNVLPELQRRMRTAWKEEEFFDKRVVIAFS
jgi:hypothetical protein